jgi:hypothetical protein
MTPLATGAAPVAKVQHRPPWLGFLAPGQGALCRNALTDTHAMVLHFLGIAQWGPLGLLTFLSPRVLHP